MSFSVSTEVLDTALRGGEPARALALQCAERRQKAHEALLQAVQEAPGAVCETRSRLQDLIAEGSSISRELDELSALMDESTMQERDLLEKTRLAEEKIQALDDLALHLAPFVLVSNAVHNAEHVELMDIQGLSKALEAVEHATSVASHGSNSQLRNMVPNLQDKVSEITSLMQFRFLDLVSISQNRISINCSSGAMDAQIAVSPARTLARAGLLDEALRGIVKRLVSNKVAEKLRSAVIFFASSASSSEGPALEWSDGDESDGELLEFDLDDLEDVAERDIDNMTNALDIANTASRAIAIFDLLRDNLVGKAYSSQLAMAVRSWLADRVLPAQVVLTSLRPRYQHTGVPSNCLHGRILAASSAAKVLEAALHSRGADPSHFQLKLDISSVENAVAAEVRGQALLAARRAIGAFPDARRDPSKMIPCPLSASAYVPREDRTQDYFPPCMVSQAAATVLDAFSSTRTDALLALSGGSMLIGNTLMTAAYECADAYRADVPLQHGDDLRGSLRLKSLYYNDCMMLKYACQKAIEMDSEQFDSSSDANKQQRERHTPLSSSGSKDKLNITLTLGKTAESVMVSLRQSAEKSLMDNLNSACRNGALGAYGTLVRIQRSSALMAAYNSIRELVAVFAEVMSIDIAEIAAASLCEKYLTKLCDAVLELSEILPDGCTQIEDILDDALAKTATLMKSARLSDSLQPRVSEPEIVTRLEWARQRALAYKHIVSARMEDIVSHYREGKYGSTVDKSQVESFILKIFEDTPLRATFISDLDITKEAEEQEWEDW